MIFGNVLRIVHEFQRINHLAVGMRVFTPGDWDVVRLVVVNDFSGRMFSPVHFDRDIDVDRSLVGDFSRRGDGQTHIEIGIVAHIDSDAASAVNRTHDRMTVGVQIAHGRSYRQSVQRD